MPENSPITVGLYDAKGREGDVDVFVQPILVVDGHAEVHLKGARAQFVHFKQLVALDTGVGVIMPVMEKTDAVGERPCLGDRNNNNHSWRSASMGSSRAALRAGK